MGGHGLPGPYRTGLRRRLIADGEDEVQSRGARSAELFPALAAEPVDWEMMLSQGLERQGMDAPFGWLPAL